jgi:hypothetical protein
VSGVKLNVPKASFERHRGSIFERRESFRYLIRPKRPYQFPRKADRFCAVSRPETPGSLVPLPRGGELDAGMDPRSEIACAIEVQICARDMVGVLRLLP